MYFLNEGRYPFEYYFMLIPMNNFTYNRVLNEYNFKILGILEIIICHLAGMHFE